MKTPSFAIGTKNRVKIKAAQSVLANFYDEFDLVSSHVNSGVSETPTSFREGRLGAKNRAYRAVEKTESSLGIGIEGYIENEKYLSVWVIISDSSEVLGQGGGGRIRLPTKIASQLPERDLEKIMDELENREKIGQQEGAVGILTDNKITRTDFTITALTFAFSDYINSTYQ